MLEAFDTSFSKRDCEAAKHYWSPNYIQHSAHIEPGRDGLFNLIKSIPLTLKYEPSTIVAEGDFVIVHGRFSGNDLSLRNRVGMAPLTRTRAENPGHVPNDLMVEYYAQRASSGLIITEGT